MKVQFLTVGGRVALLLQLRGVMILATGLSVLDGSIRDSPGVVSYTLVLWAIGKLSTYLSMSAPNCANGITALKNVQDFLLAPELVPGLTFKSDVEEDNAVELQEASFAWHDNAVSATESETSDSDSTDVVEKSFHLKPLTLSLESHELIAIVGPVGSGKSSIAAALTGEMLHNSGSVKIRDAQIAYHSQTSWIQNATVRDNITFGLPYDPQRYQRIIHACALNEDIDDGFPAGDATELGERGINISGGQKARIQLARTLYRGLKTVILDDPLSAVDAHTSSHIFENVIAGPNALLDQCCRILITHQLHFLSRCDRVLWMVDGCVRASGTLEYLLEHEPEFVSFSEDKLQSEMPALSIDEGYTPSESVATKVEQIVNLEDEKRKTLTSKRQLFEKQIRDRLMVEEERGVKPIPFSLYWWYSGLTPRWTLPALAVLLLASQAANVVLPLSIAWWTSRRWNLNDLQYAMITTGLMTSHLVTWSVFYVAIVCCLIIASRGASKIALKRVLYSPMSFFDTTPAGRIINRFTLVRSFQAFSLIQGSMTDIYKDGNYMDTQLASHGWIFLLSVAALLSIVIIIIYYAPISAGVFIPWVLITICVIYMFRSTPLEIKRLEVLRASNYISRLSEGVNGRQAIVSCGRVDDFSLLLRDVVDQLNGIHFMSFATRSWMMIMQDILTSIIFAVVGLLVLAKRHELQPGIGMLVVSFCTEMTDYIKMIITSGADIQRGMNGVERIEEYTRLESEGMRLLPNFDKKHADWPALGGIVLENASLRYRPNLPLALHNLNLVIAPGEKVAVVGRTGAGKSSLLALLLRTVELAEGKTSIDGVDIRTIGLVDLRKRISVIPQDPTLFRGTLKFNLDPSGRISEETMATALHDVGLIDPTKAERTRLTLTSPVESEGKNFSTGDRQLIALARALVRDNRIIIIDEATSNVDPRTDSHVQRTINEHPRMRNKTIVTIAHRIGTVVGYDKVVVMDQGTIVEMGKPRDLWRQGGSWRMLCDRARISSDLFAETGSDEI